MSAERAKDGGLRLASSLRFVFTKKNKEPKVVDIRKMGEEGKQRGRRTQTTPPRERSKNEQIVDETKKTKAEWGRAFKHMNEGKEPTFPIFLQISEQGECAADLFFQKMFREMAFGSFPKGVFYDKNRDCLVCTEISGRRNSSVRQSKMEKFIRVCIPNRIIPAETPRTMSRTTEQPSRDQSRDTEPDFEISREDRRELMEKRAIKFIHRCNQRLELPVMGLQLKYGLPLDRIFQEIKLFLYTTVDILSPWDANILQEDSYQTIRIKERVTSLKPQRHWKKLSQLEQISMICQFCKINVYHLFHRTIDSLTPSQERFFRHIRDKICGLAMIGVIPPSAVEFDGTIRKIWGVKIGASGLKIDKEELNRYREPVQRHEPEETKIHPVSIQRFKTIDLQKIQNGIQKQKMKTCKMIRVLTEACTDELPGE